MDRAAAKAWTCARCLRLSSPGLVSRSTPQCTSWQEFHTAVARRAGQATARKDEDEDETSEQEQGAMSRRLSEMAEETMDTGSKSDRKLMEQVGFSDDLKKQLEERITQTTFRARNQKALSEAELPVSPRCQGKKIHKLLMSLQSYAGQGTKAQAAADVWTGEEAIGDAALRMLDDSYKKIRQPTRVPRVSTPRASVRPPLRSRNVSAADRLAAARDNTSMYAVSQQENMSEKEREQFRKQLKSRFQPGARPMPTTLQGLTSLANERIEDAIARGQFKNIQRGKGVNTERDHNANSPFLDTTEYFMNKIIQKQEIVPPWIEKQQELVKTVQSFRSRMRNDWKRHAARLISSKGGSLQDQIRRAQAYALAEERLNPPQAQVARLSEIDSQGNLSTLTIEQRIAAGVTPDQSAQPSTTITVTESAAEDAPVPESIPVQAATNNSSVQPMAYPFRDPGWEKVELAYHTLAISEINSLTRSYNLMAPKLAQKPYTNQERELKRCFADVAPQLAGEIERRANAPPVRIELVGRKEGGIMDQFAGGHQGRIRDEDLRKKGYGFKEFWRDIFGKEDTPQQT